MRLGRFWPIILTATAVSCGGGVAAPGSSDMGEVTTGITKNRPSFVSGGLRR